MENFNSFGLPEYLMQALNYMKFTTPTAIQAAAIPPALEGKDILGSAQTGTGKTGVFRKKAIAWVDRLRIGDFGGSNQRGHVQIAEVAGRRANADGFVSEFDVFGFAVGFGVDDYGFDAHFAARTLDA
mgnify:CR=1 FL=1